LKRTPAIVSSAERRTSTTPASTEAVLGLVKALRACADGEAKPDGCDGMVYAKGDKVHLTDETARFFVVSDPHAADAVGWTYEMPRREAPRMADGFEKTLRDMGRASASCTPSSRLEQSGWRCAVEP
jgi:hypothetical protein